MGSLHPPKQAVRKSTEMTTSRHGRESCDWMLLGPTENGLVVYSPTQAVVQGKGTQSSRGSGVEGL
ncbi:hypothetical protein C5167_025690 [Papaver somniferum]|uniref:Uncharacterized protein n=1 Tax=Papaver somniferum TaxID=3469 RepID=A0A4Y7JTB2_PAPSO|nr:hypothetical protein C5167_025690 [Papaver somniferum]